MIIEIDKRILKNEYNNDIKKAITDGFYMTWTQERIKGAFSFGNGTEKDLKQYMENNKKYCVFLEV